MVAVLVVHDRVGEALEVEVGLTVLDRRWVPGVVNEALDLQVLALQWCGQDFVLASGLLAACRRRGRLGICGLAVAECRRQSQLWRGASRATAAQRGGAGRERKHSVCDACSDHCASRVLSSNMKIFRKFQTFTHWRYKYKYKYK
jgi:hypothetical protein